MGITKTEGLNKDTLFFSNLFKAIGHPSRLSIILFLIEKKQCIGNDILDELPIAQPTLSRHLKELKDSGILNAKAVGNSMQYCINTEMIEKISIFIQQLKINSNSICC